VKGNLSTIEEKINILKLLDKPNRKSNLHKIKNKNLIYYSVYFDTGYVDLLYRSIESILNNSIVNFEFLIITDEATRQLITKLNFSKDIVINFLITKTPEDGWEASENKIKIFNYSKINNYNKILFLDCDIICVSDISKIFNINVQENILYTARNENLTFKDHCTIHHGFDFLKEDHAQEMKKNNQMPFNSGQFLFKNCAKMKMHFKKIKIILEKWKGEYFFEQCFMNYYFCKNNLTNNVDFNERVLVSEASGDLTKKENKCLIHFIKPILDARTKLNYINNFLIKKL
jgi:lipopolysaccharide biosynthesis glycosyltransferase